MTTTTAPIQRRMRGFVPVPGNARYAVDRAGAVANVRTGRQLKVHMVLSERKPGARRYPRVALFCADGVYDFRYVHRLVTAVFGEDAGNQVKGGGRD